MRGWKGESLHGVNEHKQPFVVGVCASITCVFSTAIVLQRLSVKSWWGTHFISGINGILASFVLSGYVKVWNNTAAQAHIIKYIHLEWAIRKVVRQHPSNLLWPALVIFQSWMDCSKFQHCWWVFFHFPSHLYLGALRHSLQCCWETFRLQSVRCHPEVAAHCLHYRWHGEDCVEFCWWRDNCDCDYLLTHLNMHTVIAPMNIFRSFKSGEVLISWSTLTLLPGT